MYDNAITTICIVSNACKLLCGQLTGFWPLPSSMLIDSEIGNIANPMSSDSLVSSSMTEKLGRYL